MTGCKDGKTASEFRAKLESLLAESSFAGLGQDIKDNVRAVAMALLSRLDVVSREEFEAQNAVLAQAIENIEKMEEQITALEKGEER